MNSKIEVFILKTLIVFMLLTYTFTGMLMGVSMLLRIMDGKY